jgi:hypothetical protein
VYVKAGGGGGGGFGLGVCIAGNNQIGPRRYDTQIPTALRGVASQIIW